jgi:hypothetical protein
MGIGTCIEPAMHPARASCMHGWWPVLKPRGDVVMELALEQHAKSRVVQSRIDTKKCSRRVDVNAMTPLPTKYVGPTVYTF